MQRNLRKYLFASLLFFSFEADSQTRDCPLTQEYFKYNTGWIVTDTTVYHYTNNKRDTLYSKTFKKGNGVIFRYSAYYDCPEIFDEERTDFITWSVPDSSDSFAVVLTDNNFRISPFTYTLVQFGYSRSKGLVSATGSINGRKNGNTWIVTGNLSVIAGDRDGTQRNNRTISFTKEFSPAVYTGSRKKKKYAGLYPF